MLAIITSRNPENVIDRNFSNYNFQNYWQLSFPEMLAVIIFWNVSSHICYKCQRQMLAIIISRDISNLNFLKCWRHIITFIISKKCQRWMLTNIIFRNDNDKCQILENLEILASNVSKSNFQKYWRSMLAVIIFRNVGDEC